MYYIVNETNQIIAADESLLTFCGFTHINELNLNITLEKVIFDTTSNNQLNIIQGTNTQSFSINYTPLSSLLGQLTLITLDATKEIIKHTTPDDIDIDSLLIKADTPKETITIIDTIENELEIEESFINDLQIRYGIIMDPSNETITINRVPQQIYKTIDSASKIIITSYRNSCFIPDITDQMYATISENHHISINPGSEQIRTRMNIAKTDIIAQIRTAIEKLGITSELSDNFESTDNFTTKITKSLINTIDKYISSSSLQKYFNINQFDIQVFENSLLVDFPPLIITVDNKDNYTITNNFNLVMHID